MVSETKGHWGKAIAVPGLAALNTGKDEELTSVSCSPGGKNCTAGGEVLVSPHGIEAFAVTEKNGKWGQATPLPGLDPSKFAKLTTLQCPSAGNCSAGGKFVVAPNEAGWVISEKNGRWGKAIEVPGPAALAGGDAEVDEMSCPSNGNCAAGGSYLDSQGAVHVFVASEKNGTWGKAIEVPGLAALNKAHNVGITRVTCPSTGNCVAFGNYQAIPGEDGKFTAFVASETKGVWGQATQLPGLKTLAVGSSSVHMISCPSTGHCSAAGFYEDKNGFGQAFVVDQK